MASVVGIIALACNFAGVLPLVRNGVPHRVLGDSVALSHDPSERAPFGGDRQQMWSFVGMVLFALGTTLQMVTIVLMSR